MAKKTHNNSSTPNQQTQQRASFQDWHWLSDNGSGKPEKASASLANNKKGGPRKRIRHGGVSVPSSYYNYYQNYYNNNNLWERSCLETRFVAILSTRSPSSSLKAIGEPDGRRRRPRKPHSRIGCTPMLFSQKTYVVAGTGRSYPVVVVRKTFFQRCQCNSKNKRTTTIVDFICYY